MTPSLQPDPTTVLDPLPVDDAVKADAWDAFHSAAGPSHFKSLMDPLALPDEAKADLWDMRYPGSEASVTRPEKGGDPAQKAAPEPPKPNQVQRVSPATPNPPTAALATTPEQPATLNIQLNQLSGGQRRVVMFPKGQGQPPTLPPNSAITHDAFGNTYAYRPDLIRKAEIHTAAKNNTLPQILGGPEGLGAPDKSALMGDPIAVTGRAPDGTEAQSTATDAANLSTTIPAVQALTPPGGSVSVDNPATVVRQRGGSLLELARSAPLHKALVAFAAARPEERTPVAGILRRRLNAARSNPAAWNDTTRMLGERFFRVSPTPQDLGSPSSIQ